MSSCHEHRCCWHFRRGRFRKHRPAVHVNHNCGHSVIICLPHYKIRFPVSSLRPQNGVNSVFRAPTSPEVPSPCIMDSEGSTFALQVARPQWPKVLPCKTGHALSCIPIQLNHQHELSSAYPIRGRVTIDHEILLYSQHEPAFLPSLVSRGGTVR